MMTTPLAGITVLDFGQIYQGPYATMLMAKAGADVIKIEPPGGEPLRRRIIATGGDTTLPMAMLNANKRAVTLNLKSDAGQGPAEADGRPRRRAAGEFLTRHAGRPGRRLRRAEGRSTRGWSMPPAPASASAGRIATIWRWISPSRLPPAS